MSALSTVWPTCSTDNCDLPAIVWVADLTVPRNSDESVYEGYCALCRTEWLAGEYVDWVTAEEIEEMES